MEQSFELPDNTRTHIQNQNDDNVHQTNNLAFYFFNLLILNDRTSLSIHPILCRISWQLLIIQLPRLRLSEEQQGCQFPGFAMRRELLHYPGQRKVRGDP
jgi:hypothetical protein